MAVVLIRVGHSADPDDAFMLWALEAGKVDTRGLDLQPIASDIQTLNEWALEGRLEVTALSAGAYPHVADRYAVLPHGASFGDGYGPIVVARRPLSLDELARAAIAIPGRLTTAYLVLRLVLGDDVPVAADLPFDEIGAAVASGRCEAGLLIHEAQLTYAACGLVKVLDLGEWWQRETSLPLPLGLVAARRDLERPGDVSKVLGEAIEAGLAHRDEAIAYALRFGRGIDPSTADRFVELYVNDLTCDMGERGRAAVEELLRRSGAAAALELVS